MASSIEIISLQPNAMLFKKNLGRESDPLGSFLGTRPWWGSVCALLSLCFGREVVGSGTCMHHAHELIIFLFMPNNLPSFCLPIAFLCCGMHEEIRESGRRNLCIMFLLRRLFSLLPPPPLPLFRPLHNFHNQLSYSGSWNLGKNSPNYTLSPLFFL